MSNQTNQAQSKGFQAKQTRLWATIDKESGGVSAVFDTRQEAREAKYSDEKIAKFELTKFVR